MTVVEDLRSEISRIMRWYNNERTHLSLNYLTPRDYYRSSPDDLLRIREDGEGKNVMEGEKHDERR